MAPEQLQGSPVDRRADIWSLGVITWELLVGERLFRRNTEAMTADAVLNAPVVAPSTAAEDPDLAPWNATVLRALDRSPALRPATAGELADALDSLGSGSLRRERIAAFMQSAFANELAEVTGYVRAAKTLAVPVRPTGPQSSVTAQLSPVARQPDEVHHRHPPSGPANTAPQRRTRRRILSVGAAIAVVTAGLVAFAPAALWTASSPSPASRLHPFATDTEPADARRTPAPAHATTKLSTGSPSEKTSARPSGSFDAARMPDRALPRRNPKVSPPAKTTPSRSRSLTVPSPKRTKAERSEPSTTTRRRRRSDAPRRPVTPASKTLGRVNVSTPGGWADIYVDGARQGRTPIRIEIPSGRRKVELRMFGQRSEVRAIDVKPNATMRLVVPVAED